MSTKAHITRQMFDCVKTLIDTGAKNAEIENFLKLSHSTVCRIRRSESYEDYKQLQMAYMVAIRKKEQEKKDKQEQEKQEQAKQEQAKQEKQEAPVSVEKPEEAAPVAKDKTSVNYQTLQLNRVIDSQNAKLNSMIEIMRKQSELLTTISAKLAFVVDELTR